MSLPEIGRELGATHVVDGSVRRSGDRLRVVAQLIDAETDRHLWAETYDRNITDIFDVQSELAQHVARSLEIELSQGEIERIQRVPTENLTAYDYYVKGLDYYRRYRAEDNETAIELFQKAVDVDPGYALGLAGLADGHFQRTMRFGHPRTELDRALATARRAIDVDPELAEAHKALGNAHIGRGRNREALASYRRAVELKPSFATAVGNIGYQYYSLGQLDRAVSWNLKALRLDPVQADNYADLGAALAYLELDELAHRWLDRAEELEPDGVSSHFNRGELALFKGNDEQALQAASTILNRAPTDVDGLMLAATTDWLAGRDEAARERFSQIADVAYHYFDARVALAAIDAAAGDASALDALEPLAVDAKKAIESGDQSRYHRYRLAQIAGLRGDVDECLDWLDLAIESGWIMGRFTRRDPALASARQHPRFAAAMAKVDDDLEAQRERALAVPGIEPIR